MKRFFSFLCFILKHLHKGRPDFMILSKNKYFVKFLHDVNNSWIKKVLALHKRKKKRKCCEFQLTSNKFDIRLDNSLLGFDSSNTIYLTFWIFCLCLSWPELTYIWSGLANSSPWHQSSLLTRLWLMRYFHYLYRFQDVMGPKHPQTSRRGPKIKCFTHLFFH